MSILRRVGLLVCLAATAGGIAAAAPQKPNILWIVADDLGYADVGFQGCRDIPTPHLDRLAKSGLRCTSGYVTHPYCSPSRACLLTGRYQQRFGHERNPKYDPDDHAEGLPLSQKLLPDYLRSAGYTTGWIGKWHLGAAPEFRPEVRGFSETFGFIGGGHHYLNWAVDTAKEYNVPIERNGQPVEVTNHLTVAFGQEAAAFIQRHTSEPWFLYLAFHAPHMPNEPTPERWAAFSGIKDARRRAYAAQVSLLDDAVGEALQSLHESNQDERTLVVFFSDNGGPITEKGNGSRNLPLRDGKGSVYEGGVRVPFVVSWPGTLPAGRAYDPTVCSVDLFATALALAGVAMPTDKTYDSVDLMPYLTGQTAGAPNPRLFWRSGPQWALLDGQAKFVRHAGQEDELYNLADDLIEAKDLAVAQPHEVKRLSATLEAWDKELIPPVFGGLRAPRRGNQGPTVRPAD